MITMSLRPAFGWIAAAALVTLGGAPGQASLAPDECESAKLCVAAGSAEGIPGAIVMVDVTLVVDQHDSTWIENVLLLPDRVHIAEQVHGTPDCVSDAEVTASFLFLPAGCAADLDCVGVRASVASYAAVGSGTVLYRCAARIAPDAAPGRFPVQVVRVSALSDGYPVCAINGGICDPIDPAYALVGLDGEISVRGPAGSTPAPTSTPWPTRTPTSTKTPCAPWCPGVVVGSATAVPGEEVTIAVTFRGGDTGVSGLQTDIRFSPNTPIVGCALNPAIAKGLTAFHITEERLRSTVLGLDLDVLIPDGAVLYTCSVRVAADAPPGVYPLTPANILGSTARGLAIPMAADAGAVLVYAPSAGATSIPTRTSTPTPPPPPTVSDRTQPALGASSVRAAAGERLTVTVRLFGDSTGVDAIQNDLIFEPAALAVPETDGKPECSVDPQVRARDAIFVLLPPGCRAGRHCDTIRAELFGVSMLTSEAQGFVLYRCNLRVNADTPPRIYPLRVSGVSVATADGWSFEAAIADGAVEVLPPQGTTPLPTWTASPTPTATSSALPNVVIDVGSAVGSPGERVAVDVTLHTAGFQVAWLTHTIEFDDGAPVVGCTGGSDLTDTQSLFDFEPRGCTPGIDCYGVRATMTTFLAPSHALPDGAVLYTCDIRIPGRAALGVHPLFGAQASAIDVRGRVLAVTATHGAVTVVGQLPAPSAPAQPSGGRQPSGVEANGRDPVTGAAGSGCSLGPGHQDSPATFWLAALPWLRRLRSRRRVTRIASRAHRHAG